MRTLKNIMFFHIILCASFLCVSCAKEGSYQLVDVIWNDIKTEYISNQTMCSVVSDGFEYHSLFISYLEPWIVKLDFEISDATVAAMSTCGLADSYIDVPLWINAYNYPTSTRSWISCWLWVAIKGPEYIKFEYHYSPYFFTIDYPIISELFTRNDFVRIMIKKYAELILEKTNGKSMLICKLQRMEMLMSSDVFLEKLNHEEMKNLMAMALKMVQIIDPNFHDHSKAYPRFIMSKIMLLCKYKPFEKAFEDVKKDDTIRKDYRLFGYDICIDDSGIVEKHARNFLKTF